MDIKEIKAIIDLMKKNSITEFELEQQEFKVRLKRGGPGVAGGEEGVVYMPAQQMMAAPTGAPQLAAPAAAPAVSSDAEIKSPMIGTFYRAPSPESGPYVEIGTEVGPDTVVCLIEAMKVMNEIKAETRGVITQILLDNAKPVEFGQALFKIKPV
ncbi:MAG: acetyl-CoA carboxylase biotin carboxyl carrier protein [Verrucomicrobia bacterium]|nr:acetyl-CoA carboxylase biotin carboxyl carrier protein [Verrucomicrobiota bacterium]